MSAPQLSIKRSPCSEHMLRVGDTVGNQKALISYPQGRQAEGRVLCNNAELLGERRSPVGLGEPPRRAPTFLPAPQLAWLGMVLAEHREPWAGFKDSNSPLNWSGG